MRVNGLFGHVRDNNTRSLALFAGFLVAFQLLAAVVLFLPLVIFDEGHAPLYGWGGYMLRYVPLVTLAAIAMFGVQLWWHVNSVRKQVDFRYVDNHDEPRLCGLVEPLAMTMGLPAPYVAVIESDAMNAFACGIVSRHAVVVVTRGLIAGLDDDELAAVIAHELVHIRNGDTRLMASANILLHNLTLLQKRNVLRFHDWRQVILMLALPVFFPLTIIGGIVTQLAFRGGYLSRLLISSAREYIADAEAVRITQNPAALVSALRRIDGRSAIDTLAPEHDAMMIDGATEGALASHPTIAERIAAIVKVTGSMALIAPARRDTRAPAERGFGRRGTALSPDFAGLAAKTSQRPTLGALIRVTANSDRNIFGLTRVNSLWVLLGLSLFLLFHRDDIDDPRALAARFDIRPVRSIVEVQAAILGCTARALGVLPGKCDGRDHARPEDSIRNAPGVFGTIAGAMARQENGDLANGLYRWPDGSIRSTAPADVKLAQTIRERCFQTDPYSVGDRGLHRIDEAKSGFGDEISMPRYLGYAAQSAANFDIVARTDPSGAIEGYMNERKAMIEVAHRFFGQPGLDRMQAEYAKPEHAHVIAAIRAQANDGRIVAARTPQQRAELTLLADTPGEFTTCEARRAVG